MAELMDAYQRTHETMGTLAKNVGKNNETLQATTVQLDTYASTIDEHHKQIEVLSKRQDVQDKTILDIQEFMIKLLELNNVQHIRITSLEKQCDFLLKHMQKTQRQIFWYLIAVIIVNVGGLIAFHMVTP